MNLAIIGATGNVGRKIVEVLENSPLKVENLYLVASKKSAGQTLKFKNKNITIEQLENYEFSKANTIFAQEAKLQKIGFLKLPKKQLL